MFFLDSKEGREDLLMHLCLNLLSAVCTPTIWTVTVTWPGWPSGSDRGLQLVYSPSALLLLSSEDLMWQKSRNTNSAAQVRLVELLRREILQEHCLLRVWWIGKVFLQHFKKGSVCRTVHIILWLDHSCQKLLVLAVTIPLCPLPLCFCVNIFTWQPPDSSAAPGNPTALLWPFHVSPAFRSWSACYV